MKVAIVSSKDIAGGAARATYRLHLGLQELNYESVMVVRCKTSQDPAVYSTDEAFAEHPVIRNSLEAIQNVFINQTRSEDSNTLFSLPYPGIELSHIQPILDADVINIHWIGLFQSISSLKALMQLNKPVVWTLHDCSAFTGGCHYPAGCDRYQKDTTKPCQQCPQLLENPFELAARILQDKLEAFQEIPLTIVTPSQWLADCVRQSYLFQHHPVQVIPYGLETDVFQALPKAEAKQRVGLPPEAIAILIGANDGNEKRKGFFLLFAALQRCLEDPQFQEWVEAGRIMLLIFWEPSADLEALPLPVRSFGQVETNEQLCALYAAADLFVLPSLEDNLPNTMLEAMSCGTPVVAFAAGGMLDAVVHGETGLLVPTGDLAALADAILKLVFEPHTRQQFGMAARQRVETQYPLQLQAERYGALYHELLQAQPASKPESDPASIAPEATQPTLNIQLGSHFAACFEDMARQALLRENQIVKRQIQRKEAQLTETRETLHETRLTLNQVREKVQRMQGRIGKLETELERSQIKWGQSQTELVRLTTELAQSQDKIAEIECSRFWKLRSAWVRLIQRARRSET